MARNDRKLVRDRIGHAFADPSLLQQALTHRSAGSPHNERLEFLGDAVVNLIAAEALYQRWPKADEGVLTRARAELVREASLAVIARQLELGERLTLGPGELKSGGFRRDSILADAVEAVVAAIYLDAGYEACRAVVLPWFEQALAALPKPLPAYELVSESGEEHAKVFLARCTLSEPPASAEGQGTSRRLAEQAAAAAVLERLEPPLRQP
ncbi:ribonuclease III family protein [Pseudoxanthomonas taiwanensis]|uniref:Ribonuclease 3 n=1 Tax=Pseudoxanthomonas taiwanensis J19 TaxID=935569 RepID=A0A562D2K8_9GAMM|nr:ribonuclease III family protein [Pseudoxanthomonas taiwanensis]TWH03966.1 ribonuclease-3 [Pseudoxanthomonas taiwanensis J19]